MPIIVVHADSISVLFPFTTADHPRIVQGRMAEIARRPETASGSDIETQISRVGERKIRRIQKHSTGATHALDSIRVQRATVCVLNFSFESERTVSKRNGQ